MTKIAADRICSNCRQAHIEDRRRTATLCNACVQACKVDIAPSSESADDIFARIQRNHAHDESLLVVDIDGYGSR